MNYTPEEIFFINDFKKKQKKRLRRKAHVNHERHNKVIATVAKYPPGVYEYKKGSWRNPSGIIYLKEQSRSSGKGGLSTSVKKQCNRMVRRYHGLLQRGDYKKVAEYWWEID